MNKYICECCGGHIEPITMKCEYCGTQYKKENEQVFRIETFRGRVQTFESAFSISNEELVRYPKEVSEIALRHVADQLAQVIAPYCEFRVEDNPMICSKRICARIKVVEPMNKGLNFDN